MKQRKRTDSDIVGLGLFTLLVFIVEAIVIITHPRGDPWKAEVYKALARRVDADRVFVSELPPEYRYSNAILEALEYEVEDTKPGRKIADVHFRYVDVLALADRLGDSDLCIDEYYAYCTDAISGGNAPMAGKTIRLSFEQQTVNRKKQLSVVDSFELLDVLSGGTVSRFTEMTEGME